MNLEVWHNPQVLFWLCILAHLISDYCMQGVLSDLKQRDWWDKQIKDLYKKYDGCHKTLEWQHLLEKKYRGDYMAGLICHSAMWSIMTFLPLLLIIEPSTYTACVLINGFLHMVIDHLKANVHMINLRQDQVFHAAQIAVTLLLVI